MHSMYAVVMAVGTTLVLAGRMFPVGAVSAAAVAVMVAAMAYTYNRMQYFTVRVVEV